MSKVPLLRTTQVLLGEGSTLMTSVNLNYRLKDPISECSHTLGPWGFGLDHVDLGGTQVTLNK